MTAPPTPTPGAPASTPPPPPAGGPPEPPRRRGGAVGWGVALIGAGVLWLLVLAGVTIRWELVLPGALIAIGVLVLVIGRRGWADGLIGLGAVVAVVALVVPFAPGPATVSAGDRTHEVTDPAELPGEYRLGAGTLTIDLRGLDLAGEDAEVSAQLGFGELIVRVPDGVEVRGEARIAAGEATAFDRTRAGIAPTLTLAESGDDTAVLDLDLQVGFGRIEVTR